jgi:hypothetical protein
VTVTVECPNSSFTVMMSTPRSRKRQGIAGAGEAFEFTAGTFGEGKETFSAFVVIITTERKWNFGDQDTYFL